MSDRAKPISRIYDINEVVEICETFFQLGAASSVLSRAMYPGYWDQQNYLKSLQKMYINALKSENERSQQINSGRVISGKTGPAELSDGGPRSAVGFLDSLMAMAAEDDQQKAVHEKAVEYGNAPLGRSVKEGKESDAEKGAEEDRKKPAVPMWVRKKI